jgi:homoserine dehydrogenase
MKSFNIALIGCGTVGGGVVKILSEINPLLNNRMGRPLNLKKVVELNPTQAIARFGFPKSIFCGGGKTLTELEVQNFVQEIISDPDIDLVVEAVGGTGDFVYNLCMEVCRSGKHLVTANKALLAERGRDIFRMAQENGVSVSFEAAVCGAIPIIKTIRESFTGDEVISVSGILNGTSNYILSRMIDENLSFEKALQFAQDAGYAEADPTLDISGGDAAHKLIILMKLIFGVDASVEELNYQGIQNISVTDMDYAKEIDARFKLICLARRDGENVYASVCPMMVKNENILSGVNGATNAVCTANRYGGKHILIGAGAGSSETASSIVADILFVARYQDNMPNQLPFGSLKIRGMKDYQLPYVITFETEDRPGITGLVTTEIGKQNINIYTVTHNRHVSDKALFSIETQACMLNQINAAISEIKSKGVLKSDPKVFPILY